MLKKISTITFLLSICTSIFANTDLCQNLNGTWTGTGNDPTGLINSPFPFTLQLKYINGMVYGYTQQVNSKNYVSFGKTTGDFLFFATCKNSVLSNSYFINNALGTGSTICGVPNAQPFNLTSATTLTNFPISYENAMTGTLFRVNLTKQTTHNPQNSTSLKQAMQISHVNINSCS